MQNISPNTLRAILREIKALRKEPLEGVTVLPGSADVTSVDAVIFGPADTPFEGGKFKMRLQMGADFPQAPPKGFFITKIFHPNVSKSGEICVNTLKKDWKAELGIKHLLLTIKCLLIVPNPESALNEEAGMLLLEDYDGYFKQAKLMTKVHAMRAIPELEKCGAGASEPSAASSKKSAAEGAKKKKKKKSRAKSSLKRL